MKMTYLLLTSFLLSNVAFAKIPVGCRTNLSDIISHRLDFESKVSAYIESGELLTKDVDSVREGQKSVAEVVFLLCAGLRQIELQRSVLGRVRMVTYKWSEREAQKSYDEAKAFYDQCVQKGALCEKNI